MNIENMLFEPTLNTLMIANMTQTFPVRRVYCVGQNYAAHAIEMGSDPDRETPFFFSKPADTVHQNDTIRFPGMTDNLHHEVELVVALNGGGQQLSPEDIQRNIFGYAVGVDLTRRDLQTHAKSKGRPWDIAKGFDYAGPLSVLMSAEDWLFDTAAEISLSVNGQIRQQATLTQLIWPIHELIAELSKYYELSAGDLIFTGTPAGVGGLQPGDEVVASITGLPDCRFRMVD